MKVLNFGKWMKWVDRNNIELASCPGIYLVCVTRENIEGGKAHVKDADYIGMTLDKGGLKGRWSGLNQSIRVRKGHSGGNAIYDDFEVPYIKWPKGWKLFVAGMPIQGINLDTPRAKDFRKMGEVVSLEYEAFAQYFEKHEELPCYNSRHNK
jgi:hypothetical protein